jgi:hypothetical protein
MLQQVYVHRLAGVTGEKMLSSLQPKIELARLQVTDN